MARIRSIKPEFWTSEQVMECSTNARLLFIGLWNFCDDCGRFPLAPKQIKALVLPADDFTVEDIRGMLDELARNGLIEIYHTDGRDYFAVTGWHHQKIDRPQAPKYPGPPGSPKPPKKGKSSNGRERSTNGRDGVQRGEDKEEDIGGGGARALARVPASEGWPDANSLAETLFDAGGKALERRSTKLELMTEPYRWLESGYDLARDVLPVVRAESRAAAARGDSIRSWAFFTPAIIREAERRKQPLPTVIPGGRAPPRGKPSYLDVCDELDARFAETEGRAGNGDEQSGPLIDAEFYELPGNGSGGG